MLCLAKAPGSQFLRPSLHLAFAFSRPLKLPLHMRSIDATAAKC